MPRSLLPLLFLSACATESSDAHKEERARALALAPKPVRVTDEEAERKLAGVKLAEPVLCDESCWERDPALFTDLDAFIKSECAQDAGACPPGASGDPAPARRLAPAGEPSD